MSRFSAYPVAAAEERSRVRNTQLRIYSGVAAVSVCAVCIAVGILVPVLILQQQDVRHERMARALETTVAEYCAGVLRNAVVSAIMVSFTITGFVVGHLTSLPPFHGTPQERVVGQFFPRFPDLARQQTINANDLTLLASAPGGVVYQTYPDTPSLFMYDMLYDYQAPSLGMENLSDAIGTGGMFVLGPRLRNATGGSMTPQWDIDVLQLVYNSTGNHSHSERNFWGCTCVVLSLTALAEEQHLNAFMEARKMDYLMFTQVDSDRDGDLDTIVPVFTSLPEDSSQEQLWRFVERSAQRNVLAARMDWFIAVRKHLPRSYLSKRNIAIIVSTVVGGSLLGLAVVIAVVLVRTREYDGRRHAPKRPPFAILTIGPCHGNELWNLASEQMIEVVEKLNEVLRGCMVASKAYPIMQLHPYTNSYITLTVSGAVHMAFDVLEELQSHPIDSTLCRLLGADGKLLLSCAVHWCTDATVNMEPNGGSYRFEGRDIVFGGRMWFFAAPNTVTLSSAAAEARGPELAGMKVEPFNSVYLRGIQGLQKLLVITDPASRRLKEAGAIATERLARMREAHQLRLGEQSRDGVGHAGLWSTSSAHGGSDNGSQRPTSGSLHLAAATGGASVTVLTTAAASLRTPPSTSVSASASTSSASEFVDELASTSSSVAHAPLDPYWLEGRTIIRRPRPHMKDAAAAGGGPAPLSRMDPNAGLRSLSASSSGSVTPGGVAVGMGGGGNPLADSLALSVHAPLLLSPSNGSFTATSPRTPLTESRPDSPTAAGAAATAVRAANRPRASPSAVVPSPTATATTANINSISGRRSADRDGVDGEAGTAAAGGGGAQALPTFPAVGAAAGPTRHFVRQGTATRNPLHIDVPAWNPLAALRDGGGVSGATSSSSNLSTPRAGGGGLGSFLGLSFAGLPKAHFWRCSPVGPEVSTGGTGGGFATAASSAPTTGPAAASHDGAAAGASGAGGGAGSALCHTLHDDGPLGSRRFQSSGASSSALADTSGPLGSGSNGQLVATTDSGGESLGTDEAAEIVFALLHPSIPVYMDLALRAAYEHQAFDMDISYDSVRVLVYYFFSSYKLLFRPLAAQERMNVYKRLMIVFGVGQQSILEHLAARCALQYLKQHEEAKTFLMAPVPRPMLETKKLRKKKHA